MWFFKTVVIILLYSALIYFFVYYSNTFTDWLKRFSNFKIQPKNIEKLWKHEISSTANHTPSLQHLLLKYWMSLISKTVYVLFEKTFIALLFWGHTLWMSKHSVESIFYLFFKRSAQFWKPFRSRRLQLLITFYVGDLADRNWIIIKQ